jgi:hypothetical protein
MEDEPTWYLVATDDGMIPPDAQRAMSRRTGSTVVEVPGRMPQAATGVALAGH